MQTAKQFAETRKTSTKINTQNLIERITVNTQDKSSEYMVQQIDIYYRDFNNDCLPH